MRRKACRPVEHSHPATSATGPLRLFSAKPATVQQVEAAEPIQPAERGFKPRRTGRRISRRPSRAHTASTAARKYRRELPASTQSCRGDTGRPAATSSRLPRGALSRANRHRARRPPFSCQRLSRKCPGTATPGELFHAKPRARGVSACSARRFSKRPDFDSRSDARAENLCWSGRHEYP